MGDYWAQESLSDCRSLVHTNSQKFTAARWEHECLVLLWNHELHLITRFKKKYLFMEQYGWSSGKTMVTVNKKMNTNCSSVTRHKLKTLDTESWTHWVSCQVRNRSLHTVTSTVNKVVCGGRFQTSVKNSENCCALFRQHGRIVFYFLQRSTLY